MIGAALFIGNMDSTNPHPRIEIDQKAFFTWAYVQGQLLDLLPTGLPEATGKVKRGHREDTAKQKAGLLPRAGRIGGEPCNSPYRVRTGPVTQR